MCIIENFISLFLEFFSLQAIKAFAHPFEPKLVSVSHSPGKHSHFDTCIMSVTVPFLVRFVRVLDPWGRDAIVS